MRSSPRAIGSLLAAGHEIEGPQYCGSKAEGEAARRVADELAEAPFDQSRDEQHQDGAARQACGLLAIYAQVFDARILARKKDLLGNHQAAGAAQDDRTEFG